MRSVLRGGTSPWGQYKTPGMLGFIRALRGRARSPPSNRVYVITIINISLLEHQALFFGKSVRLKSEKTDWYSNEHTKEKLYLVLQQLPTPPPHAMSGPPPSAPFHSLQPQRSSMLHHPPGFEAVDPDNHIREEDTTASMPPGGII